MKKIFIIFSFLIVTVLFIFFIIKNNNKGKYFKVEKKEIVNAIYASGYIDSENSVIIRSEVSGYVEKIFVKEGDTVKKCDILAKISNKTLVENLKEIDSQISLYKEKLKEDSDYRKQFLENIKIKETNYEHLKNVYERRRNLYEKGLISKEQFEEITKNLQTAKDDYDKTLANYKDSVKDIEYQMKVLLAKKGEIEKEIDKYYIKSPTDGTVLRKFVNEGDYINSIMQTNQLFSIGSTQNLETVLLVDEEYVPLIKEGMEVLVKLDSYPDKVFKGYIKTIERQSDRNSRTIKIKALVNYEKPVLLNMTVEGNIILSKTEGLFIPQQAYNNGYVQVLENGEKRNIKVEVENKNYNGMLRVLNGLKENQIVYYNE